MLLSTAISITTLFFTLVLGFFILIQNFRSNANKAFFAASISVVFWMATNLLSDFSTDTGSALFWTKAATIGPSFFPLIFFYLIVEIFYKKDWPKYGKLFLILVFISFFLVALSPTHFNISGITMSDLGTEFSPGPLYYLLFCYLFFGFAASFYILIKIYLQKIEPHRSQARLMLLGSGLSLGLALITNIILPFLGLSIASIFGPSVVLFFVFLTAIAVLRYHIVDAKVITTELFSLVLWVVLLIRIFLSDNFQDSVVNGVVFVAVVLFGVLLIRSVIREVEQKEKIEKIEKEIERAYEVEKKANQQLEELGNVKNQFLMTIQHHLRTPLTSMRGYVDLLIGGTYGKVPKKIEEVIKKFDESIASLLKMVNDFLDITQFQLGKGIISLKEGVNLSVMLEEIVNDIELEAIKKGIYLKLEKPEKVCIIKADDSKLKAALVNVFDNAVKYTKEGGVTMKLEGENKNGKVTIEIKDTGMGIPKERLPRLFDNAFERTEAAKKNFSGGKGIGLYLSGQIIKAHNGRIWAESEGDGKGSAFYIELPVGGKP